MEFEQIPVGLGMSLAMNTAAMQRFAAMSEAEKQAFVNATHQVHSKDDMRRLVDSLTETGRNT